MPAWAPGLPARQGTPALPSSASVSGPAFQGLDPCPALNKDPASSRWTGQPWLGRETQGPAHRILLLRAHPISHPPCSGSWQVLSAPRLGQATLGSCSHVRGRKAPHSARVPSPTTWGGSCRVAWRTYLGRAWAGACPLSPASTWLALACACWACGGITAPWAHRKGKPLTSPGGLQDYVGDSPCIVGAPATGLSGASGGGAHPAHCSKVPSPPPSQFVRKSERKIRKLEKLKCTPWVCGGGLTCPSKLGCTATCHL